jgi:hypothetical protein
MGCWHGRPGMARRSRSLRLSNNAMKLIWLTAALLLWGSCFAKDEEAWPPTQRQKYSYKEQEVSFRNEQAGITLAGTLTIPDSNRSLAAVILMPHSSCNRDAPCFP